MLLDVTCDYESNLAMCLAVYIASATALPLVAWEEARPARRSTSDREDEAKGRAAIDALRAYVAKAAVDRPVDLFACWEGKQQLPALKTERISPAQLGGDAFDFQQRHLLSVTVTGGTDGDHAS